MARKMLNEDNVSLVMGLIKKSLSVKDGIDDTAERTDAVYSSHKVLELLKDYYTKDEIDIQKGSLAYEIVSELPTENIEENKFYFVEVDSVNNIYSLNLWDGSKWIKLGSTVGGSAESTSYNNANYPDYNNVDLALDALFNKVYYIKPAITSFKMIPSTTTYEIGTKVDSLVFEWTVNKDILSQTLTGCTLADETVRTVTYATQLSSNKTFTLNVSDGENSASASKTISFLNKVYWGSCAEPITYDSAFILGLSNSKLTSSKNGDYYSFNAGSGEYAYFATPAGMKITSAWVNGFQSDLQEVITVSFTNASGYTSDYTITRFANSSLGEFVSTVK